MKQFQKILVGVELVSRGTTVPPGSRSAVAQAVWLARQTGAHLTLLHSTWTDEWAEPVEGAVLEHQGLSDAGREDLDALVGEARDAGVPCTLELTAERPWLAIVQSVLRGHADLVVAGKRDTTEDASRKLGSVATKLLRKCPCPVWVVKPDHDLSHKLVLAAADLSAVGDAAIQYGAYIASCYEGELQVVHAYQIPLELQMRCSRMSDDQFASEVDAIKSAAVQQLRAVLASTDQKDAKIHALRNNPSGAIKESVEHLQPDLLVMGTISRSGIAGALLGNTAERILPQVDCSLLTVKPEGFESPVKL